MSATSPPQPRVIFITGTDTGVGKTLLVGLLLSHLRQRGDRALGVKPFCCGGRADTKLISALQAHELPEELLNPFYFSEPIAPLVAARKCRRHIRLQHVVAAIHRAAINEIAGRGSCDCLLVEGAGGLLAPLGEKYTALELIRALSCEVIIAAANKLGTINHSLLTVGALQRAGIKELKLVLMGRDRDLSTDTNEAILAELLEPVPVFSISDLGDLKENPLQIRRAAKKLKKTLARILT